MVGAWSLATAVAVRSSTALVWFAEAAVLAGLAHPVVERIGRRTSRPVAIVGLSVGTAALVLALGATLFVELQAQARALPEFGYRTGAQIELSDEWGDLARHTEIRQEIEAFTQDIADRFELTDDELGGLAEKVGSNLAAAIAVWILAVMLVVGGPSLVDGALGALPEPTQGRARSVLGRAYRRTCTYLGLMLGRAAVAGVVAYGVARLLGLDVPVLLAVWVALWAFVPDVGLVIGGLGMALVASPGNATTAYALVAGGVVVAALDARIVQRRIDGRSIHLGVFLTLVAAMFGFSLYGAGGLVLGVVAVQLAISIMTDLAADQPAADQPAADQPAADRGPAEASSASTSSAASSPERTAPSM